VKVARLPDKTVPTFCWDRKVTAGEVRRQLRNATGFEWIRLASWILREASYSEVWSFLTPAEIKEHLEDLAPFLHRRRKFWEYIIGAWHELGRV